MLGYLHDVGYEFSETQKEHAGVSEQLVKAIMPEDGSTGADTALYAISKHGQYLEGKPVDWMILNIADLTIDSRGNRVTVEERLQDIAKRHGEASEVYRTAVDIATEVNLLHK